MNLSEGIERYVARKRSDGLIYESGEAQLRTFQRQAGDLQLGQIDMNHVQRFLNVPLVCNRTWRTKYYMLIGFFDFWSSRGEMDSFLMPPQKPRIRQTFIPYVYTRAELRGLLKAITQNEAPERAVDRQSLRTLLIVLYGTGATIGETLRLKLEDVNLKKRMITLGGKGLGHSRQIPIGPDLTGILKKYLAWRSRMRYENDCFLVARNDRPIKDGMVRDNFQRLRKIADVSRNDGGMYQPRICDLRVTFAVHRITSWIKNGADLNRMLPSLAAYLGQAGLGHTDRYLSLTPERFHKDLNKLSPGRANGRWRNNKALMKFIATL